MGSVAFRGHSQLSRCSYLLLCMGTILDFIGHNAAVAFDIEVGRDGLESVHFVISQRHIWTGGCLRGQAWPERVRVVSLGAAKKTRGLVTISVRLPVSINSLKTSASITDLMSTNNRE